MRILREIWFWSLALTVDFFSFLVTLGTRSLRPWIEKKWEKEERLREKKKRPPVLLIHGYLHDASVWFYHRRRLLKAGYSVYTLSLFPTFGSLNAYAEQIRAKREEIAQKEGRRPLFLIGHSMGGIVASWYAMTRADPREIGAVITLGSPLHGTWAAHFGVGENTRQMERSSPFIQELGRHFQENKGRISFFHIGSKNDHLVMPYNSAFSGEGESCLLEGIGHVTLLFSEKVAKKMETWLSGATLEKRGSFEKSPEEWTSA